MKRALVSQQFVRGVCPSSSLATIGWGRAQGTVRKQASIVPTRAEFNPEPEWKLYERGDPKLYDNWKGKAPDALPEEAEIGPDDYNMCVDRAPQFGSTSNLFLQLCGAFVVIGLGFLPAYFHAQAKRENLEAIKADYRTYPPETVALFVEIENLPKEWAESLQSKEVA